MLNPFLVTTAAIIDSVNPCAISVLILTIGFLFSLKLKRSELLRIGLSYILGIFVTYVLIGLGVLQALSFFGIPHGLATIGAFIIIGFGLLNLLDSVIPNFPIKLKIPNFAHSQIAKLIFKNTTKATFLMGVLVGLYEFPCTGGPYLFILSLLHDGQNFVKGAFYLIYYNFIFVLPLLVILLVLSSNVAMEKFEAFRKKNGKLSSIVASLIMIALGVIVLISA